MEEKIVGLFIRLDLKEPCGLLLVIQICKAGEKRERGGEGKREQSYAY